MANESMSNANGQGNDRYLIPRKASEVNRLDLQHYALRELLGTNHLAPITEPRSVLDVGTGTGQWAVDMSREFPGALVVGADQPPPIATHDAPRYSYVRLNLLRGLPFRDGTFDYVHQRLLRAGIPLAAWPEAVRELTRVVARGGSGRAGRVGRILGQRGSGRQPVLRTDAAARLPLRDGHGGAARAGASAPPRRRRAGRHRGAPRHRAGRGVGRTRRVLHGVQHPGRRAGADARLRLRPQRPRGGDRVAGVGDAARDRGGPHDG
ncbi:MAG: methyltransferase domain-containing protein [Candidatus Dormibacteraeota bacterium]|nr:methyltransferase domain-containing protein [Candidatus Dormibacteraeota bacterium]